MATKPKIITIPCHSTNTWSRSGTKFQYIVMHYVGAVSTAKNNGDYFANNPNLGASAHFFVDENNIVSSCPLSRAAGHCGVDYSGGKAPYWNTGEYSTNKKSIGIEMCCKKDGNGNWYIEPKTVDNAVNLVLWLMGEYNIPASNVIRHYDVCWKICPEPWVRYPEQWESFKKRISGEAKPVPKTEKWYEKTGEWKEATKLKITDGTNPDQPATRAEVAAMILRAMKLGDGK